MRVRLKTGGVGTGKIHAGLRALNGADVLVGIPEANTGRRGDPVGNAALLFIHTNGSQLRNIPSRPVIEPAIQQPDTSGMIAKQLAGACVAALNGDPAEMAKRLDRAGQIGESASKAWFTDPRNGWPPNAPSTVKAKGSSRPLIDTGQLRRAITHVVVMGSGGSQRQPDDEQTSRNGTEEPEQAQSASEAAEAAETAAAAMGEAAETVGTGIAEGLELGAEALI